MDINEFRDLGRVAYITGNLNEALIAWQALTEVVENANSLQQLKAEIAALERRASGFIGSTDAINILKQVLEELRQLTAV